MKREHVARVLEILADSNTTFAAKASPTMIDTWAVILADQDPEAILKAAVQHARTSDYPPTPASLIRLAKGPCARPVALAAWEEVIRWIPFGPKAQPTFSHPDIGRCLRMLGGYEILCVDGISNPSHRARFVEAWNDVGTRDGEEVAHREATEIVEDATRANGPLRLADALERQRRI